jgi:hypothetical protein
LLGERSTIDVLGFRGSKEALVFAPKLLVKAGAILLGNFRSPVHLTPMGRTVSLLTSKFSREWAFGKKCARQSPLATAQYAARSKVIADVSRRVL